MSWYKLRKNQGKILGNQEKVREKSGNFLWDKKVRTLYYYLPELKQIQEQIMRI